MKKKIVYKEQPFALQGQVIFSPNDPSQNLNDYSIAVKVSTVIQGKAILAYTEQGRGDVLIQRLENNFFKINIPSTVGYKLLCGLVTLSVELVYTATGMTIPAIGESKTLIEIRQTRFNKSEL